MNSPLSILPQSVFMTILRDCFPVPAPPNSNIHATGIGAVPRTPRGHRLLVHLSAPTGCSINDGILAEDYSLQYVEVDNDIIVHIIGQGYGALMYKVDMLSETFLAAMEHCLAEPILSPTKFCQLDLSLPLLPLTRSQMPHAGYCAMSIDSIDNDSVLLDVLLFESKL